MKLLAGPAVIVALLLTTGCFGQNHPPADSGLVAVVGTSGPVKVKGTITATRDGREVAARAFTVGARFTMLLPPGAYALSATVRDRACPAAAASVPDHAFTKIELACG
ncbi:MAG: hypothetical protein ABIS86_06540 [Streptosporangiaceae bacterium]